MITDIRANLNAARGSSAKAPPDASPRPSQGPVAADPADQSTASNDTNVPPLDFGGIKGSAQKSQAVANAAAIRSALDALNVAEDQHGDTVITLRLGKRFETMSIMSGTGQDAIARIIFDATNRMPGKDTVVREAGRLRMLAREAGRKCRTFIRVADIPGGYAIDLGDGTGRYVEILPGRVAIEDNDGSIRFKRGRGYGTLPDPVLTDDVADALTRLRDEVTGWGCPPAKRDMLIAALLESWRPDTPYPIIQFIGAAGRGKTTAARCAARCIDPSASGMPPEVALEPDDIVAAAANTHVLTADNRSKLSAEQQNLVCQIATGAEITLREFYGQTNTVRVAIARPLMITSIHHVLTAPDAVDRSVAIEVRPPRNGYLAAAAIMTDFEQRLPQTVGDLVVLLSAVLYALPGIAPQRQWRHRMVEFSQTGEAMTQAAGEPVGGFLDNLENARRTGARDYAEGDAFLVSLLATLHARGAIAPKASVLPSTRSWRDAPGWAAIDRGNDIVFATRPGALRKLLAPTFGAGPLLPTNDRELAGALVRVAPTLAALGIAMNEHQSGGRKIFSLTFPLAATVL
jgi:hypothetical protein